MPHPDHPRQQPTPEQARSVEQESKTEQKPPEIDIRFSQDVGQFFGKKVAYNRERANEEGIPEFGPDSKESYEAAANRFEDMSSELRRLISPRAIEQARQHPEDVGEALATLAQEMRSPEKDAPDEVKQHHEAVKKLFYESCRKVFPEVRMPKKQHRSLTSSSLKMEASGLYDEAAKLHITGLADTLSEHIMSGSKEHGEVIAKIDQHLGIIGNTLYILVWKEEQLLDDEKRELAEIAKMVYQIQLLRDSFVEEKYGRADATTGEQEQIDTIIREIKGEKKTEVKGLTLTEIDAKFNDQNIKTIEQIRSLITPEVKARLLDHILKAVDAKIEQGKRLAAKEAGAVVEARNLVTVLGQEGLGRRYQFIASAGEGKIVNAQNVGTMRIENFLKKYLGYDLRSDTQKKADLEKFTNMLD